ncbi:hypothetical protein ACFWAP_35110, partial [Streptomyces goshikiensis]|uniref:hypothetical protein n=1 Tax=Streptomyces goshikiensis TaxID=1942 RepID=UPI003666D5C2
MSKPVRTGIQLPIRHLNTIRNNRHRTRSTSHLRLEQLRHTSPRHPNRSVIPLHQQPLPLNHIKNFDST